MVLLLKSVLYLIACRSLLVFLRSRINPPALETDPVCRWGVFGGTTTFRDASDPVCMSLAANIWYQDILGLTRISVANMATTTLMSPYLNITEAPRSEVKSQIFTKPTVLLEDYFSLRNMSAVMIPVGSLVCLSERSVADKKPEIKRYPILFCWRSMRIFHRKRL